MRTRRSFEQRWPGLIFQDNFALEEEIWEPMPRRPTPLLSGSTRPALPLAQEGPAEVMSIGLAYYRVSGEEIGDIDSSPHARKEGSFLL